MKNQSLRFLALLLVLLLALAPLGASAEAASSPANWTDIRQLVAGYDFVLGLRADGSLLYWGSRENGAAAAANWTGVTQLIPLGYGPDALVGLRSDGSVVSTTGLDLSAWRNVKKVVGSADWSSCWVAGLCADGSVYTAHSPIAPEDAMYLSFDWLDGFSLERFTDLYLYQGWTATTGLGALRADGTVCTADSEGGLLSYTASWRDIVSLCSTLDGFFGLRRDGTVACPPRVNEMGYSSSPADWSNVAALCPGFQDDLYALTSDGKLLGAVIMEDARDCLRQAQSWPPLSAILDAGWADLIARDRSGELHFAGMLDTEAFSSPAELTNWRDVQSLYLSYSYAVALRSDGTVLIAGQLPEG